jgi:2-keto-4-pentenoate hydratase
VREIWLACCLAVLVGGSAVAADMSAEGWAEVILKETDGGAPIPLLSGYLPRLDEKLAYAIQGALVDAQARERGVGGYKAAFTSPASRERFGMDGPASGVLFADGARSGDGVGIDLTDFHQLMLETEIGFILRSAITRQMRSVDDLKTYVRAAVPVIELPDLNFADPANLRGLDIVATNIAAASYLVGPPLRIYDLEKVNAIEVVLERDDAEIDRGAARNAGGDQLETLLWLVNHLQALGQPLEEGYLLITGALGKVNPGLPGRYSAHYGDLWTMRFQVLDGRADKAGGSP